MIKIYKKQLVWVLLLFVLVGFFSPPEIPHCQNKHQHSKQTNKTPDKCTFKHSASSQLTGKILLCWLAVKKPNHTTQLDQDLWSYIIVTITDNCPFFSVKQSEHVHGNITLSHVACVMQCFSVPHFTAAY